MKKTTCLKSFKTLPSFADTALTVTCDGAGKLLGVCRDMSPAKHTEPRTCCEMSKELEELTRETDARPDPKGPSFSS